jgi:hypothetical protein
MKANQTPLHVHPNSRYIHMDLKPRPRTKDFFNTPNPSSRTMTFSSTQPLTEMSTRNLPAGKGRPGRKADNLTDVCEPIV